jgi:hypothetical protein
MNVNFRAILEKLSRLPRVIQVLAAILVFDVILTAGVYFEFDDIVSARLQSVSELQAKLDRTRAEIGTVRADINRVPELRRKYDTAMLEGIVLPKDRLKLVQVAQDSGSRFHLTQFHYRLDPDQIEAANASATNYRQSHTVVTFEGGALLDSDAAAFWEEILSGLSAHYTVNEADLERVYMPDASSLAAIRSGGTLGLVKTTLSFDWVSLLPPGKD